MRTIYHTGYAGHIQSTKPTLPSHRFSYCVDAISVFTELEMILHARTEKRGGIWGAGQKKDSCPGMHEMVRDTGAAGEDDMETEKIKWRIKMAKM